MERKREWNFWMKVGEEHLGDWVGGLCTKPISRRRRKKEKEKKKGGNQHETRRSWIHFFPTLPSVDKKYSASLSCTKKKKKKKKETIKERRTSVGKLSLLFLPSLLPFSFNLANNDRCSIDIDGSFPSFLRQRSRDPSLITRETCLVLILDESANRRTNKWARVFTRSKRAERNYIAL